MNLTPPSPDELERNIDDMFYRALRGKTVSPAQARALDWAEQQLKPALFALIESEKAKARLTTPCGYCGKPVEAIVTVTPKLYCSHSHRTQAYNQRRAAHHPAPQREQKGGEE